MLVLSFGMVLLNYWLVGVWSINGAAAAAVFSYVAYYSGLLIYNRVRLGVSVFSLAELKVLAVIGIGVALDLLWRTVVTPMMGESLVWLLVDAALKTGLIATLLMVAIYKMKISQNINDIIDKMILRRRPTDCNK